MKVIWPRTSYEVTLTAVTNKAQKKFWGSNGIPTHDLHDTGAMLYQLSYEASLEAGQVWVQFIPVIWRECNLQLFSYFITSRITFSVAATLAKLLQEQSIHFYLLLIR